MWWRRLAEVQTEHQNGEERGFKWLWMWNVRWCQTGWSYWDFHAQPSLGFTENGPKKRKYPVSGSCVDENALLISEVRGEWADWLDMIKRPYCLYIPYCTFPFSIFHFPLQSLFEKCITQRSGVFKQSNITSSSTPLPHATESKHHSAWT